MAETFKKYRALLFIIALVLLGWWAYSAYKGETSPNLVAEKGEAGEVGRDLLNLLLESNTITLDDTVFSGELFLRLQDFGKPIPPEDSGRDNPFAPLTGFVAGSDSGPTITVNVGR